MIRAFTEKSSFHVGEFTKNQFNIDEGFPKKGGLEQFADLLGELLARKRNVFEWGVNTPI